ncbi:hypothetical protein L596_015036 [Steinernema carpocapsae]|uniref:Syndecan n=1 Tax=Steinernema carpocapsae TaxID=34508 RepID=A0A4U5NEN1_STECR|nr:hypothetical protein L596_015036 [Steinernema carpocapsae]
MRICFLICCILAAVVAITTQKPEVEGSGSTPAFTSRTQGSGGAEWHSSGISPDDEDGDVEEGSGSFIEGSAMEPIMRVTTTLAPRTPSVSHTVATTSEPSMMIEEHHEPNVVIDDQDVQIIEEPVTTQKSYTEHPVIPTSTVLTETNRSPPKTPKDSGRATFDPVLKPGILAAVIGGAVVGLLAAILMVMFIIYRMRKKDEGSYALDEPKQPPHYSYAYQKAPTKEFYA